MPYFKNDNLNLLFIHIPKTGGTTVEEYLYRKYQVPRDLKSLWLFGPLFKHSYQHCTLKEIRDKKNALGIDFQNIKIFAVVRNPYHRLVSELFFRSLIKNNSNQNDVFKAIKKFFNGNENYDNHRVPQYHYLINNDGFIDENIIILRTESLNNDMEKYGYIDFSQTKNQNENNKVKNKEKINYMDYLNESSLKLINAYYRKDFLYFNYDMIHSYKQINENKNKSLKNENYIFYSYKNLNINIENTDFNIQLNTDKDELNLIEKKDNLSKESIDSLKKDENKNNKIKLKKKTNNTIKTFEDKAVQTEDLLIN